MTEREQQLFDGLRIGLQRAAALLAAKPDTLEGWREVYDQLLTNDLYLRQLTEDVKR